MTLSLSHVRENTDKPNNLMKVFKTIHSLYSDYTQDNYYLTL